MYILSRICYIVVAWLESELRVFGISRLRGRVTSWERLGSEQTPAYLVLLKLQASSFPKATTSLLLYYGLNVDLLCYT